MVVQEQETIIEWCGNRSIPAVFIPGLEETRDSDYRIPGCWIPVARRDYCGLFIAMDDLDTTASDSQDQWMMQLHDQGYKTITCIDSWQAIKSIKGYIQRI